MQVEGKIKEIKETQEVGSSGFKKRDVIVTSDEQFPQHILIQFVQDKCDLLNGYNVGDNVKIDINLRGRIWTNPQGEDVYFNTIQGWRIAKQDISKQAPLPMPAAEAFQPAPALNEEDDSDMPF